MARRNPVRAVVKNIKGVAGEADSFREPFYYVMVKMLEAVLERLLFGRFGETKAW